MKNKNRTGHPNVVHLTRYKQNKLATLKLRTATKPNLVAAIRNRAQKSALRTALKRASNGTAEEKMAAVKLLDRASRKGLIHRNAAARHKSRLARAAK